MFSIIGLKSLDELFDEYIKKYDYWLVDIAGNTEVKESKTIRIT